MEPDLPDDVTGRELDREVRGDLGALSKDNAGVVSRHLVMAGRLVDADPEEALLHARAAASRAGRLAVTREAAGLAAYAAGHPEEALRELRAARRLSGAETHLPTMADCERGLGRPERALELAASREARSLPPELAAEMRIVASGARADLGQLDAAVVVLEAEALAATRPQSWHARTFVARAEALVAAGRADEAPAWLARARRIDPQGTSGAFPDPERDDEVVVHVDEAAQDDDAEDPATTRPGAQR